MRKRSLPLAAMASLALTTLCVNPRVANAQNTIRLEDNNASFLWNLDRLAFEDEWFVAGVDSLFTQKKFFSFGDLSQPESALSDFDLLGIQQLGKARASASFLGFNQQLQVDMSLTLTGGLAGGGQSQLTERYTFTSRSHQAQEFRFFYYQDYDLAGPKSFDDDSILVINNRMVQLDGDPSRQIGCQGASSSQGCNLAALPLSSTDHLIVDVNQVPDQVEVNTYPQLLARFLNASSTTLDSQRTALFDADGSVAMQFDRSLLQGKSVTFEFTKSLQVTLPPSQAVPEPLMGLASVVCGGYFWKRRRC